MTPGPFVTVGDGGRVVWLEEIGCWDWDGWGRVGEGSPYLEPKEQGFSLESSNSALSLFCGSDTVPLGPLMHLWMVVISSGLLLEVISFCLLAMSNFNVIALFCLILSCLLAIF